MTTGSVIYSNSFLSEVVSFMDFSTCLWVSYACLTNPSSRVMSMPFYSNRIRLVTKSTPYFKIQHMPYCLPEYVSPKVPNFHQKTISVFEYLRGIMVDSSSNVILLDCHTWFFMPKPSTHHMHDAGSIVPHIQSKVFIDNQMS
jgi:hypothetical protein